TEDQESAAFTRSRNVSASINGHVGFDLLLVSAKLGASTTFSVRKELVGFSDVNGDGLPDQLYQEHDDDGDISVLFNQSTPDAENPCGGGPCFTASAPPGDFLPSTPLTLDGISRF